MRVGLVGAGYILDAHVRALRALPGIEIAAICDVVMERARAAADKLGEVVATDSLERMLALELDAVHVLVPADRHFDVIRQALAAGRHVLAEKPFVLSGEQAQELARLARSSHKTLAVNHNFLFGSAYEQMRTDCEQGRFGPLEQVTVTWRFALGQLQAGPFGGWLTSSPGNVFHELGPHLVAFGVDLAGPLRVESVSVSDPITLPGGHRTFRSWQVRASSGRTRVDLDLSARQGAPERSIRLRGFAGSAECHFDRNLYLVSEQRSLNPMFDDLIDGCGRTLSMSRQVAGNFVRALGGSLRRGPDANAYGSTFRRSIAAFYRELEGRRDPRLDLRLAHEVVEACEQIAGRVPKPPAPAAIETAGRAGVRLPAAPRRTVLVTGGTGFIGKALVRRLAAAGLAVRVVTRSAHSARLALGALPVEILEGSLVDPAFLDHALSDADAVFHLARGSGNRWEDYVASDVRPTQALAQAALRAGVRRFVFAGTIDSCYSGDRSRTIGCDTPLDPKVEQRNHYARSKAACERLLLALHREQGLPVVTLRLGIVIGTGCSPAHWGVGMFLGPTSMHYWGDGSSALPLVLVEDAAAALHAALDARDVEGACLLVTDAPLLTARDYVTELSRAMKTRIRARRMPIWRLFVQDLAKEAVKHAIRHPNRRRPGLRDWASRQHLSRYEAAKTREMLGWRPAGERALLVERGIDGPVAELLG